MRLHATLPVLGLVFPLIACGSSPSTGPTAPTAPAATPAPTPAPTPTPTPAPPPAPVTLRSAELEGANGYQTSGGASIVQEGADHRLDLHANFRTSRSGALDVRLCRDTRCFPGDLDLGPIQKFEGAQSYRLPNDGQAYRYVVIWCRGVNLPFGFGRLR